MNEMPEPMTHMHTHPDCTYCKEYMQKEEVYVTKLSKDEWVLIHSSLGITSEVLKSDIRGNRDWEYIGRVELLRSDLEHKTRRHRE